VLVEQKMAKIQMLVKMRSKVIKLGELKLNRGDRKIR